jgi:hypothetical protein
MKSSAKTLLTFTAAMALGAAATVSACTVTSTTNPNFDGGPSSSSGGSSGGSSGSNDGGGTCSPLNQNEQAKFDTACQSCFESKCCTELKGCFNLTPAKDDAGTSLADCNTYTSCIDTCTVNNPTDQDARDQCYLLCDDPTVTDPAVVTAYETMTSCGRTNCATECGL